MLYEMLAGQPPFIGPTAEAVVRQHLSALAPEVGQLRPSVPEGVRTAVRKALAKAPADRHGTAAAFGLALEAAKEEEERAAKPVPRRRPARILRQAVAAALALALGVALVVGARALWQRLHPAPTQPRRVAVLPFDVHGRADLAYLGEGMVSLLSTSLDGVGDLRCVDARAVLRWVAREQHSIFDPGVGRAAAQRFGAGLFVLGDVLEAGPRLRLQAAVYECGSEPRIMAQATSEGPADSLTFLVDVLTREVATQPVPAGVSAEIVSSAARTTASVAALKEFLRGEPEGRRGLKAEGVAASRRATELDSTFGLAWYRLAVAGGTAGGGAADPLWHLRTMLDRASRHSGGLSERDRALILAHRALLDGELDDFDHRLRGVLATYPDDVEALEILGMTLAEMNAARGRSPLEARAILQRTLQVDPENATAVQHLMDICALEGEWGELDSLATGYTARVPGGDERLDVLLTRAFYLGTPEGMDSAAAALAHSPSLIQARAVRAAVCSEKLAVVGRVFEKYGTSNLCALYRLGLGQWQGARTVWLQARSGAGAFFYSVACAAPLANIPRAAREAERRWLESLPVSDKYGVTGRGSERPMDPDHPAISHVLREYLLGLLSARLGEDARALQHARRLDALRDAGDTEWRNSARDFAASIRATVLLASGKAGEGLTELESAPMKGPLMSHNPFFTRNYERFLRAELLYALGRDAEALQWYSTMPLAGQQGIIYLAPCHLRQAQICERLGRRAEAIRHYQRFLELWKDCDPELQPAVGTARSRLARLLGEPS